MISQYALPLLDFIKIHGLNYQYINLQKMLVLYAYTSINKQEIYAMVLKANKNP